MVPSFSLPAPERRSRRAEVECAVLLLATLGPQAAMLVRQLASLAGYARGAAACGPKPFSYTTKICPNLADGSLAPLVPARMRLVAPTAQRPGAGDGPVRQSVTCRPCLLFARNAL